MNYIFILSLEHIALLKVVLKLWNQDDIKNLMSKFCFPFFNTDLTDEWLKIEDRVREKAVQLPLPKLLKDETLGFIKPIGFQILRWMEHHRDTFFNIDLPDEFLLTPQGTINEKETAKMLIENESLDISTRYKMSCVYCLEEDILRLWNKLPEERKRTFYSEEDPTYVHQHELVFLWTYDIKGEIAKVNDMIERKLQQRCSPYQYAFECAVKHGNRVAIQYFFKKLTSSERKESLMKSVGYIVYERLDINKCSEFLYEYYSDVLCILVSLMDEEQQMEVFKDFPCHFLISFLDFPWQIFFMEIANRMWNFLPEDVYGVLLLRMVDKLNQGYRDFNYRKLFMEYWQQSPNSHKRYVLNESHESYLLLKIFKSKDKNIIKLFFQDAMINEKKKFLYSYCGQDICEDLIDCEEWDLLGFFLRECISSKDEMIKFKQDFQLYIIGISSRDEFEKRKDKWDKFLHMLDDFISGFNKRKYAEDNN